MNEFDRLKLILDNDKYDKLINSKITLIGIGGVGGSSFEMLVRSGIRNITIIDFDKFEVTNLNRQILSLNSNIGEYKVDVAKKRALEINSLCNVLCINEKIDIDNIGKIIDKDTDFIIDCIDDVKAKISIIKYAIENNIKIISSMGTGNKFHPEMLEITNIWKTSNDPLAKKIRYLLKKEKINYKLPVISSTENNNVKTDNKVGSISFVPNCAGILISSYVINKIIDN